MTATANARLEIVLIVAVADNGVIGSRGAIPWRLKSDMHRFKAMTLGKPVVMGPGRCRDEPISSSPAMRVFTPGERW